MMDKSASVLSLDVNVDVAKNMVDFKLQELKQRTAITTTTTTTTTITNINPVPQWLTQLLKTRFFDKCPTHEHEKKNEVNVYCTDTCTSMCQHCLKDLESDTGSKHRPKVKVSKKSLIQVFRYMYHDVVSVKELSIYMDTSNVQSYTNNGNRVVYLDRRTQLKSKLAPNSPACHVCDRVVQEGYKYCSVWCRVVEWTPTSSSPGNLNLNTTSTKNNSNEMSKKKSPNGRKKNEHDASGSSSSSLDNTARYKPTNPNSNRKPASNINKAAAAAFNNMQTNTTNSSLTATTNHTGDSPVLPSTTNIIAAAAAAAAAAAEVHVRKPGPYFPVDLSFGSGRESAVAAAFVAVRSSSTPAVSPAKATTTPPPASRANAYHASSPSGGNTASLPPRSKFSGAPMKKQPVSTISLIVPHKRSLPAGWDLVSPRPSKRKGNPVISPLL